MPDIDAVVFDLGGVLVDWDPRRLYRRLLPDEDAVEDFLATVCTLEWNAHQDAGRPWADAVAELSAQHPEHAALIEAYDTRWEEMLGGAIDGTVELLAALREHGHPVYALTNWSAEKFPYARQRYAFLDWFDGLLVSGEHGLAKPDPRIFRLLLDTFALDPARTLFVDDAPRNVAAAAALGLTARHFTTPDALRDDLVGLCLLTPAAAPGRP